MWHHNFIHQIHFISTYIELLTLKKVLCQNQVHGAMFALLFLFWSIVFLSFVLKKVQEEIKQGGGKHEHGYIIIPIIACVEIARLYSFCH